MFVLILVATFHEKHSILIFVCWKTHAGLILLPRYQVFQLHERSSDQILREDLRQFEGNWNGAQEAAEGGKVRHSPVFKFQVSFCTISLRLLMAIYFQTMI